MSATRLRARRWPLLLQIADRDLLGLGLSARSDRSANLKGRKLREADGVARSICPYCAVGCAQLVYHKDGKVTQIEGDPASPVSRGRLCPKSSASESLVNSLFREYRVRYRRPYGTSWEPLPLERALDMIADRVIATRAATWEDRDEHGRLLNRTMAMAHLGGATLDNEENYLIKKLYTGLGIVAVENQARI